MLSWYSYDSRVIELFDNLYKLVVLIYPSITVFDEKKQNFLTLGNIGRVDAFVSTRVIGALLYAVGSGFDILRAL